jgi:hypothetical protein
MSTYCPVNSGILSDIGGDKNGTEGDDDDNECIY